MKHLNKFYKITVIFLLIFTGFVFSCSKKVEREIVIGAHLPLSGPGALAGQDQKWAYEKAAKDINDAGGIYVKQYDAKLPVKLVIVDDETDPGKAASMVERLIKRDKVDMLLSGQVGSHGVVPGMITAEKYKTYYHGTFIWVNNFKEQNFKWATMFFYFPPDAAVMVFEIFNFMPKADRPKKIGLYMEDTFDGKIFGDLFTAIAKKYNYKIASQLSMGLGGKDFSTQVLKGKSAGVDAIICMANVPETVTLIRQMKEYNFSVKLFQGFKGTWSIEFVKSLGEEAENIFADVLWSENYPFEGAKKLGEAYRDKFGKTSVSIGVFYATCQILWQAIEKAGTLDGAQVRQSVIDNTFDTVMGKVDYDKDGIALFKLGNAQWQNGNLNVIYPFELATGKLKLIQPWDKR